MDQNEIIEPILPIKLPKDLSHIATAELMRIVGYLIDGGWTQTQIFNYLKNAGVKPIIIEEIIEMVFEEDKREI